MGVVLDATPFYAEGGGVIATKITAARQLILHAAERRAYEAPPILDAAQRSGTFDVPAGLLDMAKALRKPAHRRRPGAC